MLDTLYTEKNITKTAQRLYVSQPSLTYRIQQIEQKFGVNIIVRRKTGIEFTAEGEHIALYAKKMILELEKLKDKVANTGTSVRGVLRLGVSSTFAHYMLPELLKNFLEQYPQVEISVKTGWSSDVLQSVHKEDVHIGVVRGELHWQEQRNLLHTETINVVSTQAIDLDQLPHLSRIQYKTDFLLKTAIDNWWQSKYKSLPPLTTMEVDNIQTCKELVKKGLGYAVVPNICIDNNEMFYTYPLKNTNDEIITRDTWLIYKNGLLDLSPIRAFVDFAKGYLLGEQRFQ